LKQPGLQKKRVLVVCQTARVTSNLKAILRAPTTASLVKPVTATPPIPHPEEPARVKTPEPAVRSTGETGVCVASATRETREPAHDGSTVISQETVFGALMVAANSALDRSLEMTTKKPEEEPRLFAYRDGKVDTRVSRKGIKQLLSILPIGQFYRLVGFRRPGKGLYRFWAAIEGLHEVVRPW
jgi:hypothetical protein